MGSKGRRLVRRRRREGRKTNGVGRSSSGTPSLDSNDGISLPDNAEVESLGESIPDTVVDLQGGKSTSELRRRETGSGRCVTYVSLPSLVRSRLGGIVEHGVASTVKVDLASGLLVAGDCEASEGQRRVFSYTKKQNDILVMTGQGGRYLETRRAVFPEVDMTRMAPAFCSRAAATADMATVSEVGVGRLARARSSLKRGG